MGGKHLKASFSEGDSKIQVERTVEDTDSEAIKQKKLDFKLFIFCIAMLICIMIFCQIMSKVTSKEYKEAKQKRKQEAAAVALEQEIQKGLKAGKIHAFSSKDQLDKEHEGVVEYLKVLGFTNIAIVDMDDTGIDFWNSGEVMSISINGNENITPDDMYYPDDLVIIKIK